MKLLYAAIFILISFAGVVEAKGTIYEAGVDNELLYLWAHPGKKSDFIAVGKRYLTTRKAKVVDGSTEFSEYFLYGSMGDKVELSVSSIRKVSSSIQSVGRGVWRGNTFAIPAKVTSKSGKKKIVEFLYNADEKKLDHVILPSGPNLTGVNFLASLNKGQLVTVSSRGDIVFYLFFEGKDKKGVDKKYKEIDVPGRLSKIFDVVEFQDAIYVLCLNRGKGNKNSMEVVVVSNVADELSVKLKSIESNAQVIDARFIKSESGRLSVAALSNSKGFMADPEVSVHSMELDGWATRRFGVDTVESFFEAAFFEVCKGEFIMVKPGAREKVEDGLLQKVVKFKIKKDGIERVEGSLFQINNGRIGRLHAYSAKNGYLLGVNFSKLERASNGQGWVSWKGFDVSLLKENLNIGCK